MFSRNLHEEYIARIELYRERLNFELERIEYDRFAHLKKLEDRREER